MRPLATLNTDTNLSPHRFHQAQNQPKFEVQICTRGSYMSLIASLDKIEIKYEKHVHIFDSYILPPKA